MRTVRFTLTDAEESADGWFNCGPAALCAVADLMPDEAVVAIPDFAAKHYTSSSMMKAALRSLDISFKCVFECAVKVDNLDYDAEYPKFGLVRIQWGGPWTKEGVPIPARYRKTHWIAVDGEYRFDVNAMCVGGWLDRAEWEPQLVPWLIKECVPKADGTWWPTHCWEVMPHAVTDNR